MNELEPGVTDIEQRVLAREQMILDAALTEALSDYSSAEAEALRPLLTKRAQLRRYEHGGSFAVVWWRDQWLPLDRAVSLMAAEVMEGRADGKED